MAVRIRTSADPARTRIALHASFGLSGRIDQLADHLLADLLFEMGADRRLRGFRNVDLLGVSSVTVMPFSDRILPAFMSCSVVACGGCPRDGHALVEGLLLVGREGLVEGVADQIGVRRVDVPVQGDVLLALVEAGGEDVRDAVLLPVDGPCVRPRGARPSRSPTGCRGSSLSSMKTGLGWTRIFMPLRSSGLVIAFLELVKWRMPLSAWP